MHRSSVVVLVALLLALPPRDAGAQRVVSFGVVAGLPIASPDGPHGMVTLEAGPRRFPVRFRSELSVAEIRPGVRVYQATGSADSGSGIASASGSCSPRTRTTGASGGRNCRSGCSSSVTALP